MFWAVFGHNCHTVLVPLDGDPESARGGVTGQIIAWTYELYLPLILQPGDIFMQDNASTYTARIVRKILNRLGVTIIRWPPYSPDLNPIENLWSIMKQEIYRIRPELEHLPDTEATLQLLVTTAIEAWEAIEDRILYNLAEGVSRRV